LVFNFLSTFVGQNNKRNMFNPEASIKTIENISKGSMTEHLGIRFLELGDDYLSAKMPVDHRTCQPYGILHGGASLVLAETLGSVAASCVIDVTKYIAVGLEINGNHVKSVSEGYVVGVAKPIHIGGKTHIWEVKITNENDQLVCISRITLAIIDKK
jgi:1,4-dihydroxy-2-naphthoyl-CoA hydrolase